MLVSVIINNYNYADFLRGCIDSVLGQTFQNLEIIIVDDGSTDNSREVISSYRHVAKIVLKDHSGETAARNEGFLHATGDIVAFLDADDFWKPNAIESVIANWKPGILKLQFHLQVVDSDGNSAGALMPRCRLDEGRVDHILLKTGRYVTCPTSGNVYTRGFLETIFPVPESEWPQSVDSYAATYAGFYGEIGAIQEPLGFYRVHDANMTRVANESIDLMQVEKLIVKSQRLRKLILKLAGELGLNVSSRVVTHHWMYLKLELTRLKLSPSGTFRQLLISTGRMLISCVTTHDLDIIKRVELIAWTILSVFLPRWIACHILKLGFDLAPQNRFIAALRRL